MKPTVKLLGEDGNAFMIIGRCSNAARKAKWPAEKIKEFQTRATSCRSYDELLRLAMNEFEVE